MKFKLTPSEARARWIEALRQPGLEKCHAAFRDDRGAYCVRGVACEVFLRCEGSSRLKRVKRRARWRKTQYGYREPHCKLNLNDMPDVVLEWLALGRLDDVQFVVLNDHTNMTLAEIADEVEQWSLRCAA